MARPIDSNSDFEIGSWGIIVLLIVALGVASVSKHAKETNDSLVVQTASAQ